MLATAALIPLAAACSAAPERLILVVIDTLRRDHLSVYGADTHTPNVARLAASGTVFRHAVSSYFQTTMSMGALFSGRTPSLESGDPKVTLRWTGASWCGLSRFAEPGDSCLPKGVPVLGEVMRDRGYRTMGVVSNWLLHNRSGFERGFDDWAAVPKSLREVSRDVNLRQGTAVNAAVFAALDRRRSDRFFLYVHYMDVHDWYRLGVSYREAVETVDRVLGELLDHLKEKGLLDDAVVVLTSDHGEVLPRERHLLHTSPLHRGNPAYQQLLEVPLIVSGREVAEDGSMVRSEDVFRLLQGLVGLPPDDPSDLEPDELLLTEKLYLTYRSGRFKSFWRREDGSVHLVDLAADPGELRDVAAANPVVVRAHRSRIADLSTTLADPRASTRQLSPEEIEVLRSLGYLD